MLRAALRVMWSVHSTGDPERDSTSRKPTAMYIRTTVPCSWFQNASPGNSHTTSRFICKSQMKFPWEKRIPRLFLKLILKHKALSFLSFFFFFLSHPPIGKCVTLRKKCGFGFTEDLRLLYWGYTGWFGSFHHYFHSCVCSPIWVPICPHGL